MRTTHPGAPGPNNTTLTNYGQILVALEGHETPVLDVAFLGDGDTLVSVGDDQVRVWRAASYAEADGEILKK